MRRVRRPSAAKPGRQAPVFALACIVALLFPIISASDDLSVARDAWEESASIRRVDAVAAAFMTAHAAVLPAALHLAITVIAFALHDIQVVPAVIQLLPAQCDPRSPPLS